MFNLEKLSYDELVDLIDEAWKERYERDDKMKEENFLALKNMINRCFKTDREVFKILRVNVCYSVDVLICPLKPSFSTSESLFLEHSFDTIGWSTTSAKNMIDKSKEITEKEFEEYVIEFIKETCGSHF